MNLNDLLDHVSSYAPNADLDVIMRAHVYAASSHAGQLRKNGEPYLTHPLAVAAILVELRMDVDTVATGLLHDTMEDCHTTSEDLTRLFGGDVAEMVDGVTKIGKLEFRSREEAQAENFRKMVVAMSKDVRVVLVKLADRLHNMRTLEHMRPDQQRRIAEETMDIYAPIANRLGLSRMKQELEDHCFRWLHPDIYDALREKLDAGAADRESFLARTCEWLQWQLNSKGLPCRVTGRVKNLYGIYRKMQAQSLEFEQVHDLLAFRILVAELGDCYTALGFVHAMTRPVPDRIKDYIATPKSNGYKSLHTIVVGPENRQIEIQIRTEEMHRIAEVGIAAHWKYKEGHLALSRDDIGKIARLRELFDAAKELEDPHEFFETIKVDLFANEIFVFTPKGDVKVFPQGATALDFAYSVHTEVGNHCTGAKVGGRLVPLRYALQNGDSIEILTRPEQRPSRDWLEIAKTGRALSKIRKEVLKEERDRGRQLGREMLEGELKKFGAHLSKLEKGGQLDKAVPKFGFRAADALYLAVAQGNVTPGKVVRELLPPEAFEKIDKQQPPQIEQEPPSAFKTILNKLRTRSESPVLISGEEDVLVSYARCCNPLPGEPIAGYITVGRGITIHHARCAQLMSLDRERRIETKWHPKSKGKHTGEVKVVCSDKAGMLAEIGNVCKATGINVTRLDARGVEDNKAVLDIEVNVGDVDQLVKLIRALENIEGVISVERLRASTPETGKRPG